MVKSSTSKLKSSNVSSTAKAALTSDPSVSSRSSILNCSFCPSRFQLSLFASIIRGLDSEHLHIQDTQIDRIRSNERLSPSESVTCIDWGYYHGGHQSLPLQGVNKKRKRSDHTNADDVCLALGTSSSQIHFYSAANGELLGVLRDGHAHGIRDFKFVGDRSKPQGWSLGGDSKLVQWDLKSNILIRTLSLPFGSVNVFRPLTSSLICASHLAYLLDLEAKVEPIKFHASTNPVKFIGVQHRENAQLQKFVTAARNDRFLNVFELGTKSSIGSLSTESEVLKADIFKTSDDISSSFHNLHAVDHLTHPQEVLMVINHDGVLEIFPEPFDFSPNSKSIDADSTKSRMKPRARKSTAQVRLIQVDSHDSHKRLLPLIDLSITGSTVKVAWAEKGVNVVFETIRWQKDGSGEMLFNGFREILVQKRPMGPEAATTNGVKDMKQVHLDESHAVVTNGFREQDIAMRDRPSEVIDISSAEEESDLSDREADSSHLQVANVTSVPELDKKIGDDTDMGSTEGSRSIIERRDELHEPEEPSFGEMLRAAAPNPINVVDSVPNTNQQTLVPLSEQNLERLPSGLSLGTVLTQSLRTNDHNLLQNCFHVKDLSIVRTTIERLNSVFAPTLLQRLMERLHSRPGRAGSLMVWIQWTLIAHGGYLAARPDVMRDLIALQKVVKERANGLQPLLSLKGKLDMLEAQMNLRKAMHVRSSRTGEDDEEAVVYVDGEKVSDSDLEDGEDALTDEAQEVILQAGTGTIAGGFSETAEPLAHDSDVDSGTQMPLVNGNLTDSEDTDSDSDEVGMFDEEASSTDQDSGDGLINEDVDYDDMDTDSSDEGASPPPKQSAISTVNGRL